MNRDEFDKTERRDVSRQDFEDALKDVLAPRGKAGRQNRKPTKAEIEARYRLDRCRGD